MSDASFSDTDTAPQAARKRKSTAAATSKAKKARNTEPAAGVANPAAQQLVADVLAGGAAGTDDPQVLKDNLLVLATYARQLESALAAAATGGSGAAPKPAKTRAELEAAAEKIRRAAVSGIQKQMAWKPSCKTGSAKWTYDGICPDAAVFGVLMGLDGPPTWKMKRFSRDEFENAIGEISRSVRYDELYITSKDVTVRWSDSGEFKFSGSYGKLTE